MVLPWWESKPGCWDRIPASYHMTTVTPKLEGGCLAAFELLVFHNMGCIHSLHDAIICFTWFTMICFMAKNILMRSVFIKAPMNLSKLSKTQQEKWSCFRQFFYLKKDISKLLNKLGHIHTKNTILQSKYSFFMSHLHNFYVFPKIFDNFCQIRVSLFLPGIHVSNAWAKCWKITQTQQLQKDKISRTFCQIKVTGNIIWAIA